MEAIISFSMSEIPTYKSVPISSILILFHHSLFSLSSSHFSHFYSVCSDPLNVHHLILTHMILPSDVYSKELRSIFLVSLSHLITLHSGLFSISMLYSLSILQICHFHQSSCIPRLFSSLPPSSSSVTLDMTAFSSHRLLY